MIGDNVCGCAMLCKDLRQENVSKVLSINISKGGYEECHLGQTAYYCQERISDSTKEQRGRGQTRNNGQGDHQSKALVKGCHERTRAWGHVSSQEKNHTNRDLARATAKSRAGRRQS